MSNVAERLRALAEWQVLDTHGQWARDGANEVDAHRARADAAEAECARLREELAAVRRAVRMLDGARAAIDANGQRTLRSLAGQERAGLLEELDAARRERDDWNARATAMEAERDGARAELEATERARREAEEERDAALELVAPDAVEAARLRDDRDAALVSTRVALADADLILEERERQLTAALTAVAEERARCAAVCREVAEFYHQEDVGSVVAHACADEIERECPSAHAGRLMRAPHSSRGNT